MKKINSYQWLSECGKLGIEKIAVNDNETQFKYNVCEVSDQYGMQSFEAYDTCDLLRDAKNLVNEDVK